MNYKQKINLRALKNAAVAQLKCKSGMKQCLVIPIDDANLYLTEKACYLDVSVFEMREVRDEATHLVKQQFTKARYDAMSEDERRAAPIIGNMSPLVAFKQKQNDEGQGYEQEQELDDLPF